MTEKHTTEEAKIETKKSANIGSLDTTCSELSVFFRCNCPKCGKDTLELVGLEVFYRADFLGMTHDDEFGCGCMKLDGEYEWLIVCRQCNHSLFDEKNVALENLLEWAAEYGKPVPTLDVGFICPVCGSRGLERIERANRDVRAVYEMMDESGNGVNAEVALSYERVFEGGDTIRYCCWNKHELTNQDGSPVKTNEELVRWMKEHRISVES